MARQLLDIPSRFTWATNANRTITPAQALLETPAADYQNGWDFDTRCPPRLMNYIHNLQYKWTDRQIIRWLSTQHPHASNFGGSAIQNVLREPAANLWLAAVGTATYVSYDGVEWAAGAALSSPSTINAACATGGEGFVLGGSAFGLAYSADGSSWTYAAGSVDHLANIGIGDYLLSANGATLLLWATGVSGGSAAPSSTSWGATNIDAIAGDNEDTDNWAIIDANGNCHTSSDAGDNWAQSAQGPIDAIALFDPHDVDYYDGTIVCVGDNGSVGKIARSADAGANWAESTFNLFGPQDTVRCVRALGNDLWVAVGLSFAQATMNYYYSVDDGITWTPALATAAVGEDLRHIYCDGRSLIASGSAGMLVRSEMLVAE